MSIEKFQLLNQAVWCYCLHMKNPVLSKYLSELGKKGGKARMGMLSKEEIRALARVAGEKSGAARRAKARKKKAAAKKQTAG